MKKIIKLTLVTMSFTAMSFVGVSCNKKNVGTEANSK